MIWTISNDFTNRYPFMIGKICFSFWKKKHCNYFFIDFIRENDISVLERGRDRIFRQFHVVYRYENTDRPSRNDVLLVWLRFMPDFGILTFLYVTNLLSSTYFYTLFYQFLDQSKFPKNCHRILVTSKTFEANINIYIFLEYNLKKKTLTFDWITNDCDSSFVSVEVVRAKKRWSESRNIMASVPREARKHGSSRGGKMKECGKNSPVVVCIDGSTSSGDVEATTTPPIRQSPATARRKHLSWIRILPHSCDHGLSETLFEHQQSCTRD